MSENKGPLRTIQIIWEQTSIPARVGVAVVGLLSVFALIGVGYWSLQPHYVPLANNLDPQEAAEIVSLLETEGIANKRNFSGSGILVDQKKFNQANSLISSVVDANKIESNPMGSSLLSDPGTKDHRIARDLEMRLERTISNLKPIESARVHLGIPEPTPFVRDRLDASASITVKVRPRHRLDRNIARSIIDLVSKSVQGLEPGNINLIDSDGNSHQHDESVTGAVSSQLEYRNQIERSLKRKAESMLEAALGVGRAIVQITANIDFTKIESSETRIDSKSKAPTKESITNSKGTRANALAVGAAGTAGNLGGARGGQRAKPSSDVINEEETITTEYVNGEQKETKISQPGKTTRLTIAVMVQTSDSEKSTDEGEATDSETPADPTESTPLLSKEQIEAIVKTAVGFDETRNDEIQVLIVENLVSEIPLLELIEPATVVETWMPMVRSASLGIGALVALMLGLLTLKKIKPAQVQTVKTEVGITPQRARQLSELTLLARKNPDVLSSILEAWVGNRSDESKTEKKSAA